MVQQLRKSITTLAFLVTCGLAPGGGFPQAPTSPLALRPDAPERYVVVPGDTLWGIAQRFTDSPWRWPELWGMNKDDIRNPHLIYPGAVLVLDRASGRLSIARGETGTVKLSPRTRAESLAKQGIPSIPPSVIEPFLSRPLIVEPDGFDKAPTIIATETNRVILASGNRAYVRGLADSKEQIWYVYRRGPALVDPDTNRTLAYEAIYLGTAQITRPGDPATIVLTSAVHEVGAGDKLVAAGRAQPVNYAPRAPSTQIQGRVMGIYGGMSSKIGEAGPQSVISINRGRADGLEVGHVLALYNRGGTVRDTTKASRPADAYLQLPDPPPGF